MSFTKNLLIGLGGTGQNVLLEVKRSFMAEHGKIPEEIVFLAIDTDNPYDITDPYTEEKVRFENTEFMRLKSAGAVAVAQDADWWPEGVTDWPLPGAGAAAKRMHGRAKLGLSIYPVKDRIQDAMSQCRGTSASRPNIQSQGEIRVTIVTSLAGGTGAGCWLDVANLVHEQVDIEGGDKVWGLMLLGDAFEALPGTQNKYANTVGCLRELQWLMEDILSEDDPEKNYTLQNREMRFPDAPMFNHCFLITRRTGHGEVIEDIDSLMKGLGRYAYHMCGVAGDEFSSREINVATKLYGPASGDKKGEYSKKGGVFWSVGISELVLETEMDNQRIRSSCAQQTLGALINPSSTPVGPDSEADNVDFFLRRNKLQEHERDDVIDQLFKPGKVVTWQNRRLKGPSEAKLENKSASKLARFAKVFCSDRAPNYCSEEAHAKAITLERQVSKLLSAKLQELLLGAGGIPRSLHFFKSLENELGRQRDMMKAEAAEDKIAAQARKVEFETRTRAVPARQGGLFWRGSVQQDIARFLPVAREWLRKEVDVCRKEAAATFFSSIREKARIFIDRIEGLEHQIQVAISTLKNIGDRLVRRSRSNFRVELPPLKGGQELDVVQMTSSLISKEGAKIFKKWFAPECDPDDIVRDILAFCKKETTHLGSGGIEALVQKMDDKTADLVGEVVHRAKPLWTYNHGVVRPGDTEELCVLVTAGDEAPPAKLKKVLRSEGFRLNKNAAWRPVTTANYLAVLRWENNVPAFAIDCVRRVMLREYNNEELWEQCKVGFHIDGRWRKNLPSLEPDKAAEDRKRQWAIAKARGLIIDHRGKYEVRNTIEKGFADDEGYYYLKLNSRTHQGAKAELIQNRALCANLNEQWLKLRGDEGRSTFNAKLKEKASELADVVRNTSGESDRRTSLEEDLRMLNKFLRSDES